MLLGSLLPLRLIMDTVMMATLASYVAVCVFVLALRRKPESPEPVFRAPLGPVLPLFGIAVCLLLMFSLPAANWLRLGVWWAVGVGVYAAYGRRYAEIMNDNYAAGLRLGAYGPGNHNADGTGGVLGGGMAWNEHNANYDRDMMRADVDRAIRLGGRRGPEQAAAIAAAYQASQRPEDRQSAENIAGMRERGDMNRADLAAGISRANNRDAVAASMRGQDLGLAETNMKNQFELGKLGVEQWNKDRQYRLDVQKTDAEQAKALQEQRSAREGALQRNIEAANVGPDGKPDMAAAAEYRRGIDRSVARMGADGVHQLSPLDEQRLLAGSDLLKVMRANANWLPWNPDKLKTIDPLDLTNLRVLPNGDRQITRPGKAAGQIIDRRFFQTEEGARFFGGTPTNKYDILSEGGK